MCVCVCVCVRERDDLNNSTDYVQSNLTANLQKLSHYSAI